MKNFKKAIQILLCPLIIFCLMPVNITAANKITPMIETEGACSAGLTDEGKILIAGENYEERQKIVDDLTGVMQISISGRGLAALKSDGTVFVEIWKDWNEYGQSEAENWNDIVQISMDEFYVIGLKSNGTVVSTKPPASFDFGQSEVSDWKDIVQISTGYDAAVGLKSDGTVVCVGKYEDDYNAEMSTWTDIVQIITSNYPSPIVGIKSNSSIVAAWGGYTPTNEYYNELSNWTDIVSAEVTPYHIIGVKKDGSVIMAGYGYDPSPDDCEPEGCCDYSNCYDREKWTDIISVKGYMGLKSDGTLVCCDESEYGQYDVEDWDLISEPTVGDLDGDKAVGITDLVTMAKFVHNRVPLTEETFATADLNADNTVNAIDLSILKWLMIGR
jgi:hypothetical protein